MFSIHSLFVSQTTVHIPIIALISNKQIARKS
ncbi:MAG: hypothetical protein ACI90V_011122, partial [Bacillariaceae sp.]